ncbi:MAG: endospore germination permease [Clostridia bacterium]|nr:endospore germination permease [Clostridia bacterium]
MVAINRQDRILKLGYSEAVAIAMVYIGAKVFLGYPRFLVEMGLNAAWLVVIIGAGVSMLFWLVVVSLLSRFPGKSILSISMIVLGPVLGLIVNLTVLFYLIASSSNLLRLFSDSIIITALPEAPISSLVLLFGVIMLLAAYLGLEALSRNAYISLPFVTAGVLAVLFSLYPFWETKNLLPLLGPGPLDVMINGFLNCSAFGEVMVLGILAPYFSFDKKMLRNIGIFSITLVGFGFLAITLVYLMVLPVPAALEHLAPFYQLSRSIFWGRYYQRLESVFILFWTYTAFLRLSLGLLVVALASKDIFRLPYYRPLLPALIIIFYSLALTPDNLVTAIAIEKDRLLYSWVITLLLPAVLTLIAVLRKKEEKGG